MAASDRQPGECDGSAVGGDRPPHRDGFRLLEHTADMGIEAVAASREALFVQAARGLLAVLGGGPGPGAVEQVVPMELDCDDLEELLVWWLNEVLHLVQGRGRWPQAILLEKVEDGSLRGRIAVRGMTDQQDRPQREVKAVTYHQLCVRRTRQGWLARVYLDL